MKFGKNLNKLSVCLFLLLFSLSSQTPFLASKETSQEEYKFYSSLFGFKGIDGEQAALMKSNLSNSEKNIPGAQPPLNKVQNPSSSFLQSSLEIDKIYNPTMDFEASVNHKERMLLEKFGYGQSYNTLASKDTFKEVPAGSNNFTSSPNSNLSAQILTPSKAPSLNPTILANNDSDAKSPNQIIREAPAAREILAGENNTSVEQLRANQIKTNSSAAEVLSTNSTSTVSSAKLGAKQDPATAAPVTGAPDAGAATGAGAPATGAAANGAAAPATGAAAPADGGAAAPANGAAAPANGAAAPANGAAAPANGAAAPANGAAATGAAAPGSGAAAPATGAAATGAAAPAADAGAAANGAKKDVSPADLQYEKVDIVQKISTYAKLDYIHRDNPELIPPVLKIGKASYSRGDSIYDQNPYIMNDQFGNLNTEIVTAKDEGNIRKLWRNFDDRRVPENFERVQFGPDEKPIQQIVQVHLLSANEKFSPSKELEGPSLDFKNPIKPVLNEMIQTNTMRVNPLMNNGQALNLGPRVYEDVEIVGKPRTNVPTIRLNAGRSAAFNEDKKIDSSILYSDGEGYEEPVLVKSYDQSGSNKSSNRLRRASDQRKSGDLLDKLKTLSEDLNFD